MFNISFLIFLQFEECRLTSWAEWRYHDNPDFEAMLLMGGEL
jgi:hypothetical protein